MSIAESSIKLMQFRKVEHPSEIPRLKKNQIGGRAGIGTAITPTLKINLKDAQVCFKH